MKGHCPILVGSSQWYFFYISHVMAAQQFGKGPDKVLTQLPLHTDHFFFKQ